MIEDRIRLGIASYPDSFSGQDGAGLNLAWTIDERNQLRTEPLSLVQSLLLSELSEGLPAHRNYQVADPYGSAALTPSVASFFNCDLPEVSVHCGAGVSGLLCSLAGLCQRGLGVLRGGYPDLPAWVRRRGLPVYTLETASVGETTDLDVVVLEHPSFLRANKVELPLIDTLCRDLHLRGVLVVIDESNANYLAPAESAVPLVLRHPNLIVLRGFSKAYGLGAVRMGLMLSAPELHERIRQILPPLATTPFSQKVAKALLDLGDIAAPLRLQIASRKPEMKRLLSDANLAVSDIESKALPYVLIEMDAWAALGELGILGKRHPFSDGGTTNEILRLSLPFEERRWQALQMRMLASTA
jgi:histidinol-phosphate/aromatic aminotransferase/cobyric acid decarboxylase-like protein